MKANLPVVAHTPSEILESMLANILCGESPMDIRVSMHEANPYTLPRSGKSFELRELSEVLFLVLAEHSEDIFILRELCGLASTDPGLPFFNYADFFYKLDSKQEIEFLAESHSQDLMIHRFKLLAVIDALFSIAKLSLIQSAFKKFKFDFNSHTFRETTLLMRDLSIIYYTDKLNEKPQFQRNDGVQDERFSRFSPERKSILKTIVERLTGNKEEQFSKMVRDALIAQEKEMNERFYDIVQRLFDNIKQAKSEDARKGPLEKEYIPNMAEAIYTFMAHTSCANQDHFKHEFGIVYDDANPYKHGKNEYYVSSETFELCRRYIDYTHHERDEPVPHSSFATAFKKATSRLKSDKETKKFTG